ncbi:hypothetical protein HYPSUDRAFT_1054797 [Hypholoma sublateritium FD-334 SS-4]|uniref:Uncharacterized protein n=1 Tax=Hypholoma sublateritium (strain FD-334 SS-4) TaxID=945553 RepID=A0A0D2P900_HYPSF|nr:hypothetical protein HYPSUDRAFT_1054797 [Hypholoma sublateritium FD-334 SS-4]
MGLLRLVRRPRRMMHHATGWRRQRAFCCLCKYVCTALLYFILFLGVATPRIFANPKRTVRPSVHTVYHDQRPAPVSPSTISPRYEYEYAHSTIDDGGDNQAATQCTCPASPHVNRSPSGQSRTAHFDRVSAVQHSQHHHHHRAPDRRLPACRLR